MTRVVPYNEYLNKEELKNLMQKNNFKAILGVLVHWLWILGAFTIVGLYPNLFTIIIAVIIIGAKQLACAILMHDASHEGIFENKKLNHLVGNIFGGYPIFNDTYRYKIYHDLHHAKTGLKEDPDILLTRGYPTSKKSIARKFFRDLTGITGIKAMYGLFIINIGLIKYNLAGKIEWVDKNKITFKYLLNNFIRFFSKPIIVNLIIFIGLLAVFKNPWLYSLWVIAFLTTFQLFIRIRSIAEHSVVEDSLDPYKNTRTTKANFLERNLFAPYNVNFHAEHHMLSGVPSYNLPKMHKLLVQRDFYKKGSYANSYIDIIKLAVKNLK